MQNMQKNAKTDAKICTKYALLCIICKICEIKGKMRSVANMQKTYAKYAKQYVIQNAICKIFTPHSLMTLAAHWQPII